MRAPQINLALAALLSAGTLASASPAYEAFGHLTYTRFDSSNQPIRKSVQIFRIQVYGSAWQIRTEPLIECSDGVGFYDVRRQGNKVVQQTVALAQAYKPGDSPFQRLRALLKEYNSADVFSPTPQLTCLRLTPMLLEFASRLDRKHTRFPQTLHAMLRLPR